MKFGILIATLAFSILAVAADDVAPLTAVSVKGQMILANVTGLTVYTYDPDTAGVSNCNGGCAKAWPPVLAPAGVQLEAPLSAITRQDGGKQIAYDGHPVYTYVGDSATGQDNGNGRGGIWHIVILTN